MKEIGKVYDLLKSTKSKKNLPKCIDRLVKELREKGWNVGVTNPDTRSYMMFDSKERRVGYICSNIVEAMNDEKLLRFLSEYSVE